MPNKINSRAERIGATYIYAEFGTAVLTLFYFVVPVIFATPPDEWG